MVCSAFEVATKACGIHMRCRTGLYAACSREGGQEPCYGAALDAAHPQQLGWASLDPNTTPESAVRKAEGRGAVAQGQEHLQ